MNELNKDMIMTTLPIAIAEVHDMIGYSDEVPAVEALLTSVKTLLDAAYDIVAATPVTTYYHVEFDDSHYDEEGNGYPYLNSTVITNKSLQQYINDDLVSITKISKEEYDSYEEDYGNGEEA